MPFTFENQIPISTQHCEEMCGSSDNAGRGPIGSFLSRAVTWLKGNEDDSAIVHLFKRALAVAVAALLFLSVIGIVVVFDGVREWNKLDRRKPNDIPFDEKQPNNFAQEQNVLGEEGQMDPEKNFNFSFLQKPSVEKTQQDVQEEYVENEMDPDLIPSYTKTATIATAALGLKDPSDVIIEDVDDEDNVPFSTSTTTQAAAKKAAAEELKSQEAAKKLGAAKTDKDLLQQAGDVWTKILEAKDQAMKQTQDKLKELEEQYAQKKAEAEAKKLAEQAAAAEELKKQEEAKKIEKAEEEEEWLKIVGATSDSTVPLIEDADDEEASKVVKIDTI